VLVSASLSDESAQTPPSGSQSVSDSQISVQVTAETAQFAAALLCQVRLLCNPSWKLAVAVVVNEGDWRVAQVTVQGQPNTATVSEVIHPLAAD
jgi:hypothetical protein